MKRMSDVIKNKREIKSNGYGEFRLTYDCCSIIGGQTQLEAIAHAINNVDALTDALEEALQHIEYMQSKFVKTGTGESVLSRGQSALSAYRGAK